MKLENNFSFGRSWIGRYLLVGSTSIGAGITIHGITFYHIIPEAGKFSDIVKNVDYAEGIALVIGTGLLAYGGHLVYNGLKAIIPKLPQHLSQSQ